MRIKGTASSKMILSNTKLIINMNSDALKVAKETLAKKDAKVNPQNDSCYEL